MWLQHSTSIYKGEGDCVVDRAHTSFRKVMLNETDSLSYRGLAKLPLPFSFKTVYFVNEAFVDVVDDNSGSC